MPFRLDIHADKDLLLVRHSGVVTIDEIEQVILSIEQQCAEKPASGVLLDLRDAEKGPSKTDYLEWFRGDGHDFFPVAKTAVLGGERYSDEAEFIALAGQNRGYVVWEFTDESEAVQWLTRRPEDF